MASPVVGILASLRRTGAVENVVRRTVWVKKRKLGSVMPLFGAHMSIAGGLYKAVEAAAALGMETVQIFTHSPSQWAVKPVSPADKERFRSGNILTKNNSQWRGKPMTDEDARLFRQAMSESGIKIPTAHNSYLINLASPDAAMWKRSIDAMVDEIRRSELLGLTHLVAHPGSYLESSVETGLRRVAAALDECHAQTRGAAVQLLLEITAGQGTNLGHRFEHLATVLDLVRDPDRLGVCFDTCHAFAAGYAMSTERDYRATMRSLEQTVGTKLVKAFHLNDSKREFGSRVDRHEHIGRGHLGLAPFRFLLNDPRFRRTPMYLETPKGMEKGKDLDVINLRTLRRLISQ